MTLLDKIGAVLGIIFITLMLVMIICFPILPMVSAVIFMILVKFLCFVLAPYVLFNVIMLMIEIMKEK